MRKLILAALLALTPLTANANWYVSHHDADICVPLEDLDLMRQRRTYYGGGPFHTPQQLRALMAKLGIPTKVDSVVGVYALYFKDHGAPVSMIFFEDKEVCKIYMAGQEP